MHSNTFARWLVACMLFSMLSLAVSAAAYAQSNISLNGAGATFPYPLLDTWRVEYKKINPQIDLNYQSIGSGGGILQFTEKTVDFGGTDAPLTASQRAALSGPAVHIPETIGSVVAAYNIDGVPKGLKLTGPILGDIFLGQITRWDDSGIMELNPGLTLPDSEIVVVHRSDGSGTTFVWTDYLSKVSPAWSDAVGKGTAVSWPTGIAGKGNEGVANLISTTPNAIGYVELAYALTTEMEYAFIENQEGNFIEPTIESTRAAVAESASALPGGEDSWEGISLTNAPGAQSYPIASFSYLLLYQELGTNPRIDSEEKATALLEFIDWAITDGQELADELHYVPLPDEVVSLNKQTLGTITYNGQPVLGTEPGQKPFSISTSFGGNMYKITGQSDTAKATSFTINPERSVVVIFEGSGEVELTLPKEMISNVTAVAAGSSAIEFTKSEGADSTTLEFRVPEGENSVEIMATVVVPEFRVVALLVLSAALVAALIFTRLKGNAGEKALGSRI